METNDLIQRLARDARPIRLLPPPRKRAVNWLAISAPAVAIVVVLASPRLDLSERLTDVRFLFEQAAALATATAAAVAAFAVVIPGHDRRLALLPLAPLTIWLGGLVQGSLEAWLRASAALNLTNGWPCLPGIAMVGAVPALTMVVMLRRGVPIAPRLTVMLGALAAAALGNVGLRLVHSQDASLMILVWQFGSVALLSLLAGWGGRSIMGDTPQACAHNSPSRQQKNGLQAQQPTQVGRHYH
ncbi:NrsF family protein [Aminobacter ciceronei]|uniref:NrsF family protein n=1 Tax=Aminobacter ciceronei TaxID=150723 RepID=UPI0028AF62BB|nr:NrsF family protein [Aminobacter ciceronei]